jgi:hypothetical protein
MLHSDSLHSNSLDSAPAAQSDRRPLALLALYVESSTDQDCSLAHPSEAKSPLQF